MSEDLAAARRAVLAGASLTLLSAPFVAASLPAHPDAELLAACAAYQARNTQRIAAYAGEDEALQDAARDAEWDAYDAVAAFPPALTDAGRAAKAAVAFAITERHLNPDGTGLDEDLMFARQVLAEVAGISGGAA
jgi:histidinol-phosphate/aromatic aminotransferase/cobyric acid decarboxylase-like protein